MSPTLLAHLLRLQRQTLRDIADDNRRVRLYGRKTNVTDFYSPHALTMRYRYCRPDCAR